MGTSWGYVDYLTSAKEGWGLTLRIITGWQIEATMLQKWSDEEATLYVAARAAEGSELHKRAWSLVTGRNQP